jgi:hypothetical protein
MVEKAQKHKDAAAVAAACRSKRFDNSSKWLPFKDVGVNPTELGVVQLLEDGFTFELVYNKGAWKLRRVNFG